MSGSDDSILTSIKKLLGIQEDYTHFDLDVTMHINSVLSTLTQLGIGTAGFMIADASALWADFVSDSVLSSMAKQYVYLKVRLAFDPPSTSFVIDAMTTQASQLEWRMNTQREYGAGIEIPDAAVGGQGAAVVSGDLILGGGGA